MGELKVKVQELADLALALKYDATPPAPPDEKGAIQFLPLWEMLKAVWPDGAKENRLYVSDNTFEICTIADLRRFVEWDKTDLLNYVGEALDCDDFAQALAGDFARYKEWSGFPVGIIWGALFGGHAFTIAVAWPSLEDRTPRLYYIEPQGDWELAPEMVEAMVLWLVEM